MKGLLAKIKAALAKEKGGDEEAMALLEAAEAEHQESIRAIEANKETAVREAKSRSAKLKAFEGLEPDQVRHDLEELEELRASAGKGKEQTDTLVRRATEKVQRELEKTTKALEVERSAVTRLLVDNGLTAALVKAGVTDAGLKYAKAHFAAQVNVDGEGDQRAATIEGKPLEEAVATWAKSDDAKPLIRGAASTGAGAGGGAGGAGAGKSMTRAAFSDLTPADQSKLATEGVKLTD